MGTSKTNRGISRREFIIQTLVGTFGVSSNLMGTDAFARRNPLWEYSLNNSQWSFLENGPAFDRGTMTPFQFLRRSVQLGGERPYDELLIGEDRDRLLKLKDKARKLAPIAFGKDEFDPSNWTFEPRYFKRLVPTRNYPDLKEPEGIYEELTNFQEYVKTCRTSLFKNIPRFREISPTPMEVIAPRWGEDFSKNHKGKVFVSSFITEALELAYKRPKPESHQGYQEKVIIKSFTTIRKDPNLGQNCALEREERTLEYCNDWTINLTMGVDAFTSFFVKGVSAVTLESLLKNQDQISIQDLNTARTVFSRATAYILGSEVAQKSKIPYGSEKAKRSALNGISNEEFKLVKGAIRYIQGIGLEQAFDTYLHRPSQFLRETRRA